MAGTTSSSSTVTVTNDYEEELDLYVDDPPPNTTLFLRPQDYPISGSPIQPFSLPPEKSFTYNVPNNIESVVVKFQSSAKKKAEVQIFSFKKHEHARHFSVKVFQRGLLA